MLLSVGGNAAVEFWQRLLEEVGGEMDVVKSYAEEDDDEVSWLVRWFVGSLVGWLVGKRFGLFFVAFV